MVFCIGLNLIVDNNYVLSFPALYKGVNDFGFDFEDPQQLTKLILKISSGEIDLEKMVQEMFEYIQKFFPHYFLQGLTQVIEYALGTH